MTKNEYYNLSVRPDDTNMEIGKIYRLPTERATSSLGFVIRRTNPETYDFTIEKVNLD